MEAPPQRAQPPPPQQHPLIGNSTMLCIPLGHAAPQDSSDIARVSRAFRDAFEIALPESILRKVPANERKRRMVAEACEARGMAPQLVNAATRLASAMAPKDLLLCGAHALVGACRRGDLGDVLAVVNGWPWGASAHVPDVCLGHMIELDIVVAHALSTDTRLMPNIALATLVAAGNAALLGALSAAQASGALRVQLSAQVGDGTLLRVALPHHYRPCCDAMLNTLLDWPGGPASTVRCVEVRKQAARKARVDTVRRLLDMAPPLTDAHKNEVFAAAVDAGRVDVAHMLLNEYGARADGPEHENLFRAVIHGDLRMVELLLLSADAVHEEVLDRCLILASDHCAFRVGRMLVARGARADCEDGMALQAAAGHGNSEFVVFLLSQPRHPARADCDRNRPLMYAAMNGREDTVRTLLSWPVHPARADSNDGEALVRAATNGAEDTVRTLLSWPVHPARADSMDGEALLRAATCGATEIVRMLLSWPLHPARADCHNGEALLRASARGHAETVELLLSKMSTAPLKAETAMVCAADNGHSDVIRTLLAWDVAVEWPTNQSLARAAEGGHLHVVEQLLLLGVSVDCMDGEALIRAAREGHTDMVRLLLREGARVDRQDYKSLKEAARCGRMAVSEVLLASGAPIPEEVHAEMARLSLRGWSGLARFLLAM